MDPRTGQFDAGIFFICIQRDRRRQFVPLQRRLGSRDRLTEYIEHSGSVPSHARRGQAGAVAPVRPPHVRPDPCRRMLKLLRDEEVS
jgi:hypothetical protein